MSGESDCPQVVLKTENEGVMMHSFQNVVNKVASKFENARWFHEENIGQAIENQRRSYEEGRRRATCYYTETSIHYHAYRGCPALGRSKNIYETTVGEAGS